MGFVNAPITPVRLLTASVLVTLLWAGPVLMAPPALAAPREIAPGAPPTPLTSKERDAAQAQRQPPQAKPLPPAERTIQDAPLTPSDALQQSARPEERAPVAQPSSQPTAHPMAQTPPDPQKPAAEKPGTDAKKNAPEPPKPQQLRDSGFSGANKSPAPPHIFISTLPQVPGKKLINSFGFHCQVAPYSSGDNYFARMAEAMDAISARGRANGANAFINMRLEAATMPAGHAKPTKTVQGVPIPPEMTDEGAPPQVIIHICGDFVRIE